MIIPTLPHLKPLLEEKLKIIDLPVYYYTDPQKKWSVFKSCQCAIAVSGTVGLELVACNVPHLIAYKMNALSWWFVKRLVKTRFAHLANIILDKSVVPEFIQGECTSGCIAHKVLQLIEDTKEQEAQKRSFEKVRSQLLGNNGKAPSESAADYLLSMGT